MDVRHGVDGPRPVPLARGRRGGRGAPLVGGAGPPHARRPRRDPLRRAAIRERLRALFSIGLVSAPIVRGAPLLPSAAHRRPGAARPLRAERPRRRRPRPDRSGRRWPKTGPPPSTGTTRATTGASSPTASPRAAARRACCACATWTTGRDLSDVIPARAGLLPGVAAGRLRASSTPVIRSRARCRQGEENYHRRVYEHVLGRDWREDPLVFGGDRPPEDWPNVHLSPDGRWLAVSVSRGWTRTDVYLRDLTAAGAGFTTVIEGVDAIFGVELRNDRLYLQTNLDAPRSRLVAADLAAARAGSPGATCCRRRRTCSKGAALIGEWIVAVWLRDASSRVTIHTIGGERIHDVALPVIGSVAGLTGEWDGREAFLGFTSYAVPPTVYRLALPEPALALWARARGRRGRGPLPRAAGALSLARRHARLHVPRRRQGPPHRRPGRGPPHRLRRLQREPHARPSAAACSSSSSAAGSTRWPTCAEAANTARTGTARACSTASRTCSTISPPPASSWCAKGTSLRTASPSWAAATAGSSSARP